MYSKIASSNPMTAVNNLAFNLLEFDYVFKRDINDDRLGIFVFKIDSLLVLCDMSEKSYSFLIFVTSISTTYADINLSSVMSIWSSVSAYDNRYSIDISLPIITIGFPSTVHKWFITGGYKLTTSKSYSFWLQKSLILCRYTTTASNCSW